MGANALSPAVEVPPAGEAAVRPVHALAALVQRLAVSHRNVPVATGAETRWPRGRACPSSRTPWLGCGGRDVVAVAAAVAMVMEAVVAVAPLWPPFKGASGRASSGRHECPARGSPIGTPRRR
jgi:hypothetical protein